MKTQSPLPWYGTDSSVAKHIADLIPATVKHLTIPFCGGMGILPHVKARAVLANDLHEHAIHFFRVLKSSDRHILISRCKETLCHPAELQLANEMARDGVSHINRAWSYWARCWLGRKGAGGTPNAGKTASVRRNANGGTNASRLVSAADDLTAWAELFRRCEFTCEDFRDVLTKAHDRPDCGIYCDPPWLAEGGLYEHTFTVQDHATLAAILKHEFESSPVVIRHGDDPLIRELYPESVWTWHDARSRNQANTVRGEVWIVRNIPS